MSTLRDVEKLTAALRKYEFQIRRALEHGARTHSFDDVVTRCLMGDLDTFILENSIIMMELSQYARCKVYHGFIAAGDLQEILDFEADLMDEARLRKADVLSLAGRRGWSKVLKEQGWNESLVIMQKEVPYEQNVEAESNG